MMDETHTFKFEHFNHDGYISTTQQIWEINDKIEENFKYVEKEYEKLFGDQPQLGFELLSWSMKNIRPGEIEYPAYGSTVLYKIIWKDESQRTAYYLVQDRSRYKYPDTFMSDSTGHEHLLSISQDEARNRSSIECWIENAQPFKVGVEYQAKTLYDLYRTYEDENYPNIKSSISHFGRELTNLIGTGFIPIKKKRINQGWVYYV